MDERLLVKRAKRGDTAAFAELYGTIYKRLYQFALYEYSRAVTPQIRQTGNRLSSNAGTAYASLLA